jgi:general secretion pathway protein G
MVVVMGLIVILASIATTQYRSSVTRASEAVLKEDLYRMREAIDQYYADKNKYPSDLQTLVSDQYMREVPKDPFTGTADSWQTVPAEPEPGSANIEPGVYNVKSGSDRTALDGTQYSEW